MPGKDYYQILGVGRNATEQEIKQAYRRLARRYHPDVNPGDKAAEARFKEVNEAYEVLSDPEKRRKYDQYGDQWQYADQFEKARAHAGGAGGFGPFEQTYTYQDLSDLGDLGDLGSIFENIFTGTGGRFRTSRRPQAGGDMEHPVEVTLEEAYHGTLRTLQVQAEELCTACGGRGIVQRRPCTACGGAGARPHLRRLEVRIPPGVRTGSRIRIAGQGHPGIGGGPPGDLYLVVRVLPHERFQRVEDDLTVEVPVPLVTAVLGGEVRVPTLKGQVVLKIPPETQNGKLFRLAGQGMPHLNGSGYGDMFARVKVVLPVNLNDAERRLFQQLRNMRGEA
ncbi:MAG: J domain-containing protein [Dehalococcoidia bacterium]|nr:J domain-containing protein [Dehalococcoidia bacterium]